MTVLVRYQDFRRFFARIITSTGSFTFVNSNPDTITRGAGSFSTDGVQAGMVSDVSGSVNNNKRYHPTTVAALTLTLASIDAVTAEGPVTVTITSFFVDPDGYEQFPGPMAETPDGTPLPNLVRANGFDDGFTGIPEPYAGVSFQVSVNGGAADAVKDTADYHWYLSQRTDDAALQYLTITQKASTATQSFSGSVDIVHSAKATTDLGTLTNPTMDQIVALFKHCHLYVRRNSDGSIQWVDLLKEMLS